MSNTYEIIVETGWSETFEVKAGSLAEALELIDNDEIDPLSYGTVSYTHLTLPTILLV